MPSSKRFAALRLILTNFHVWVTKAYFDYVAIFVFDVHSKFLALAWCAKRFVKGYLTLKAFTDVTFLWHVKSVTEGSFFCKLSFHDAV